MADRPLKILHLEDNPLDAELLLTTLVADEVLCDIQRVDTRDEFVSALQREEFDLVISDLSLPSFDGITALGLVRREYPDLPFIFVSGTIGEEAAIESLLSGATDYVLKHKFSRLVPAVRRASSEAHERKLRREADDALRASEERYRQLFESNPHPMWVYDIQTLNLLAANDAAVQQYGYSRQEFAELTIRHLVPADELQVFLEFVSTGDCDVHQPAAYRHMKKDGTLIDVEIASHALPFGGKSARLVLANDITEKNRIEAQLLRAQRIESIGTLASGIAHDLNNILAPILMGLDLIRERSTDERSGEILNTLEVSARRGADLVKQILTFARGIEGQRGALQIRHYLNDIKKLFSETLPKSIKLIETSPKDLWLVSGDGTQLHQLLMNLCINSRDAMTSGGTIKVSARNETLGGGKNAHGAEIKAGGYVVIEVEDTGTGIPGNIIDKIFEPFFTTKEYGKGTGLGLSTVQTIVSSHGGFIEVETEIGKGTLFRVFLPALPAETVVSGENPLQGVAAGKGELILIVDDEAAIRDISRATLEACGYRVLTAANGAEGLSIFMQHRDEIQAVLSDMNMPIMDGKTMLEFMEKLNPNLRYITASGMPSKDDGKPQREPIAGRASLRKPFSAESLLHTMNAVLRDN